MSGKLPLDWWADRVSPAGVRSDGWVDVVVSAGVVCARLAAGAAVAADAGSGSSSGSSGRGRRCDWCRHSSAYSLASCIFGRRCGGVVGALLVGQARQQVDNVVHRW